MSNKFDVEKMVIKAQDPYWIQIRIGIQPKMLELDPDRDEINADPQPCLKQTPPGR
jgi:hypothetical protein